MGIFTRKPKTAGGENTATQSDTTTLASDKNVSNTNLDEKDAVAETSLEQTHSHNTSNAGTTQNVAEQGATSEKRAPLERQVSIVAAGPEEGDEVVYPTGAKLGLISLALCLSVFLFALDNTIIATAIPKITDQFNSLGDVGWYASAYLLTTCALQLFFGKLYTFYPIKTVYLTSILIFEIGSAICGASPNSETLIVGRAVAGVGSAGLFSGALIIIAYSVPLAKRPVYTGIIGAMYGIASVAGPLLGGAFTDGPGWGWCFYINLPLGAIAIAVIFFFFESPKRKAEVKLSYKERARQLDLAGTFVFIAAIVSCLLALQWGGSAYPWSNWRIILCLTIFGVLAIIFIAIQYYMKEFATVPFHIIKQRSVAAACAFACLLGASFFVLIFWVPIWFQAIKGATALKSGIMCLPMILSLVIANIVTGIGTTIIGYYNPFYYISVVLSAIGAGLLTTFQTDTGAAKWIGYQIIYGFGVGFGMQQALITIQTVLPLKDIPTGTALASFMQTFGGALFVSAAQNVFNNRLIEQLPVDAPGINPLIITHVGATSLKDQVPAALLAGVQRAYNSALTQTWYIAVAMSCLTVVPALLVEWRSVKGMKPGGISA